MNKPGDNLREVLKSADPAFGMSDVIGEVPNLTHLQRAHRMRRAGIVGAFILALAAPIVGFSVWSSRGGNSGADFALSDSLKGAGASGQGVAAGVGSLVLGNSPSELVTADQNFRSARDGFSFPNWGGAPTSDMIDASTMAALFTKEAVCVDPAAGSCVMLPAAQKVADQMNAAIAAGRCEGMSVLSQRFFDGLDARTDGVIETVKVSQGSVMKQVGYWWATQIAPTVSKESKRFRAMTPSAIVAELEKGLQQKLGYTMGLYSVEGGHSVTPIAVTTEGTNKLVYIYDNNYPGQIRKIVVDTVKESWTYSDAGLNSGAAKTNWQGVGAGSLDLTPMAVRKGPFKVSFGATRGVKAQAYSVLVTQNDPKGSNVGVRIRARLNGKSIDVNTMDPTQVAAAPFPIKNLVSGSVGRGAIAYVPVVLGDTGKLSLDVVTDESTGPVMMSILRTGTSSIVVESGSDFTVELTTKAFSTDAEISFGKDGSGSVQLANGPRAAEIQLSKGQNVEFTTKFHDDDAAPDMGTRRIEDPLPEFVVRNAEGKVQFKGSLAGVLKPGDATTDVIKFNSRGAAVVVTETVEASDLDMKFVKSLVPTEQPKYDEPTKAPDAELISTKEKCDPTDIFSECYDGFKGSAPTTTVPDDELDLDPTFRGVTTTTTVAPAPGPSSPPLGPITYTITFNSNGGTSTGSSTQTCDAPGTVTLSAPTVTKAGFTFAGWNTELDGSGTTYTVSAPCNTYTLYAQWTQVFYTITYYSNGGSPAGPSSETCPAPGTFTLSPPSVTKAGFTFAGWNTQLDGSGTSVPVTVPCTSNYSYYAQWTPNVVLACVKLDQGGSKYYALGRDYAMVVVKAGKYDTVYLDVKDGDSVGSWQGKDISHIIFCDEGLSDAGSADGFTSSNANAVGYSVYQCQLPLGASNDPSYWESWSSGENKPCLSKKVLISTDNTTYEGASISDALSKVKLESSDPDLTASCTITASSDGIVELVDCDLIESSDWAANEFDYSFDMAPDLKNREVKLSVIEPTTTTVDEPTTTTTTAPSNGNGGGGTTTTSTTVPKNGGGK